jgi:hypothetical protein
LVDACDVEQVLDQAAEMPHIFAHLPAHHRGGLGIGPAFHQVQPRPHCHDGIAQFMGENRQKLILAAICGLQHAGQLLKRITLRPDLLALTIEVEEDARLGAKDIGLDRLLEEVHRPRLIAPEAALLVGAARGQEDDRNIARPLACAHEFGKLEAVHAGHLYVEQGERHIMLEEKLERLLPGSGLEDRHTLVAQQRLERQKIFFQVIDQKAVGQRVLTRHGATRV